jgi:hypothetical protein
MSEKVRRFAVMTRRWARVVIPLLGAVALTLTMLPAGAGATTARVPMRAAGLLRHRSCVGLLSAADFPGTYYSGSLHIHGEGICTFSGGSAADPKAASVALEVFASTAAAHAFFVKSSGPVPADLGSQEFTKLRGYGSEAVYGTVCSSPESGRTVCGLSVEVRVVNDYFSLTEFGISAPLVKLASKVISDLCPSCKS